MPLSDLTVILVRPRFPENIGMAARACANMGASALTLVAPERWEYAKAAPLATGQGLEVLQSVRLAPTLQEALASCTLAFGATARTGGWRQNVISPRKAAETFTAWRANNEKDAAPGKAALVFGSEDRGLENAEVELCTHLVSIPTAPASSSLNLAQSVLILLYECFTASLGAPFHPGRTPKTKKHSRPATIEEHELLFATMQETLLAVEHLPQDNPEWFMQPVRRFFRKSDLSRHEFDFFMGICRNIKRIARK